MVEYADESLRGSRFLRVDLSGSRLHGVMLQNVKITDAWVSNVDISCALNSLTVNGVEVSGYVRAELDRRHPELRRLRANDVAGLRDAWQLTKTNAEKTLARARSLPEAKMHESVDGEWSYVDTLRHLVYATDRWIVGPVLGEKQPSTGWACRTTTWPRGEAARSRSTRSRRSTKYWPCASITWRR